jgi:hypothetical protein
MEFKKGLNYQTYVAKKHHQQYDKRHKLEKEERKGEMRNFDDMTADALFNFLENGYDKLEKEKESGHIYKLNQAIIVRIKALFAEFGQEQEDRLRGILLELAD